MSLGKMDNPSCIKERYNHCQAILQKLYEQRNMGLFCDIAVVVEGKTFHAHKNILSACSSYFYTTLSKNNQECTVFLDTVSLDGFSHLLEFFYTSQVPGCHMNDFLSAAQSLNVCIPAKLHFDTDDINGNGLGSSQEACKIQNISISNHEVELDLEDLELFNRTKKENPVETTSLRCTDDVKNGSVVSRKVHGACLAKIKTRLQTARLPGAITSSRKLPHPQTRLVHVNGRKKRQGNDAKSDHCTSPRQWTKVKTNGSHRKSASGTSNIPLEAIDLSYDIHNNSRNSSNLLTSSNVEYSPATESSQPSKSRKESREASVLITQELAGARDNILDGKRVRCEGCKKLLTYTCFLSHQVSAGEESFNCDVCEKLFYYSCQLSQHQKTHHQKTHHSKKLYQCDQCGKQLKSMEKLRDHVAYHGEARPHQCNLCDKAYKVKNDLTQHIRVKHMEASKGKPPLVQLCEFCGQAVKHYKSHKIFCSGIKKFQCKFCLQAFYRLSELKRHTWTHTGELPYQCRVCGKRCRHPSNLKKHIRTVHKEEIRVQIDKEHASPKLLKDFLPQEVESNQLIMGKMELGNGSFLNITESSGQLGGSAPSTKASFTTAVAIHGTVPSMSHALCTALDNSSATIPSMHTSLPTALQQHHKVASPLPSFKSLLTSPHVDVLQNSFHQKT